MALNRRIPTLNVSLQCPYPKWLNSHVPLSLRRALQLHPPASRTLHDLEPTDRFSSKFRLKSWTSYEELLEIRARDLTRTWGDERTRTCQVYDPHLRRPILKSTFRAFVLILSRSLAKNPYFHCLMNPHTDSDPRWVRAASSFLAPLEMTRTENAKQPDWDREGGAPVA